MHRNILLLSVLMLAVLTGCPLRNDTRAPHACAVLPQPVEIVRRVYVPINPLLTTPEPVAEGPLSECPDVAAQRKAALKRANSHLQQIKQIQGTEVKP
ncbi:hypothetical protein [Xanthomonas albilineans]|uniref:Uncharacterized protein n=1 Tax=Xanthomonas albilineans (strain GPE PC73 / CFBP 7063) TaxID=380358 RepID=D2U9V1_XANAP|nr:hypothetical protein [Xanthomonas albilineans]CBA14762.1 hypothetical protein XALC_0217 [Xanthomonas albilineans GPE PC73]